MLFNSFSFMLIVLPSVVLLHHLACRFARPAVAQLILLIVSLGFYALAGPAQVPLLLASILFNYWIARAMSSAGPAVRLWWLRAGLTGNLLFLGSLKYSRFAVSTLNGLTGLHAPLPHLWLPLGISFFTIQQIMYLVDCYEGLSAAHGLFDHASFVAFFPYITSGPLTRSRHILPQVKKQRDVTAEEFSRGLFLLGSGFFKKVVIADSIGRYADTGFSNIGALTGIEAWIACVAYCLQIYFDFSGYSDMAVGAGRLLGFKIPINFNAPYRSTSISEFWQRWHITLSQFITTYLYTPLIRSMGKVTLQTAVVATVVSMALAGLWHGPAWTFVIFGVIHGVALAVNQVWRKKIKLGIPPAIGWALTMAVVLVGFIAFRSPNPGAAISMIRALFLRDHWVGWAAFKKMELLLAIPLVLALPLALLGPDSNELAERLSPGYGMSAALASLFLISFLFLNSTMAQEFVYYAF